MVKSIIDMSRPNMFYGIGLGIIMLASLAVSNVPALSLSLYWDFAYRREACALLFLAGSFFGAWMVQRHMARAKAPWRIPQSQVSIPYTAFFVLTLIAVVIAH